MAASMPCFSARTKLLIKRDTRQLLQVRAQSFRDDQGRRSNIVDSNMSILTNRIEEVRIRERLERCCRAEHGWNYAPGKYGYKVREHEKLLLLHSCFELVSLVGATIGLTIVSGTIFLCILSFLLHSNQLR